MKFPCLVCNTPDLSTYQHKFVTQSTPQNIRQYHVRVAQQQFTHKFFSWTAFMNEWQNSLSSILKVSLQHIFQIPKAAPSLNSLSYHNRNPLFNNHEISLYSPFPGSRFAPIACLPQIHSHYTSQTFIYTSTFFASIITLTKAGECWISNSGFHIFHMQDYVEKISK